MAYNPPSPPPTELEEYRLQHSGALIEQFLALPLDVAISMLRTTYAELSAKAPTGKQVMRRLRFES